MSGINTTMRVYFPRADSIKCDVCKEYSTSLHRIHSYSVCIDCIQADYAKWARFNNERD